MKRKSSGLGVIRAGLGVGSVVLGLVGCGSEDPGTLQTGQALQPPVDARRSLAVTDQTILSRFGLRRVLDQLVSQSRVSGLTSLDLFRQWWDTQNPGPGLGRGPHCDDQVDPTFGPVLNAFPYSCRPAPSEGAHATCDPFAAGSPCAYVPIGLFNRFDIAPGNGAFCGEYRIVYAKQSGISNPDDRNLVIFEAAMPNPLPLLGLEGCRPIAEFWARLSNMASVQARAVALERFYFQGLAGVPTFPPVVHVQNFGDNAAGRGQIRTNQFSNPNPRIWSLREFKLARSCGLISCSSMRFVPVTTKGNPYGPLFGAPTAHAKTQAFKGFLPGQVAGLSAATIGELDFAVPDTFDAGQSQANGTTENNYVDQFTFDPGELRAALTAQLTQQGSTLTAEDIVKRAQALSCAGCHRSSNGMDLGGGIVWPSSQGFTHVSERQTESVNGETRYMVSDALTNVFLPHRKLILEQFIDRQLGRRLGTLLPIGGLRIH